MACLWPRKGWRHRVTRKFTGRYPPDESSYEPLTISCGGCLDCRLRNGLDWAVRCSLELQEHSAASWLTLTYDDAHLVRPTPEHHPTLYKPHLSGYLKRLRSRFPRSTLRFFGVGEYGDRTHRPHYHVILYGLPPHEPALAKAWPFGHIRAEPVTPANIAYTAGYSNKKIRPNGGRPPPTYVDPESGELFEWQEPFRLTSRRPGIGGAARRHVRSWRHAAIHQGRPVPVPRYLHDAYRAAVGETSDEYAALELERQQLRERMAVRLRETVQASWLEHYRDRDARLAIAEQKHATQTDNRTL